MLNILIYFTLTWQFYIEHHIKYFFLREARYPDCSKALCDSLHTVASHWHVINRLAAASKALSNPSRYTHDFHVSHSRHTAHSPSRHTAGRRVTCSAFASYAVDKPGNEDISGVEVLLGVQSRVNLLAGAITIYESLHIKRAGPAQKKKSIKHF